MTYSIKNLGEIGSFIRGVTYKKGNLLESYTKGCTTLLRANNINNGLVLNDLQFLPESFVDEKKILQKGDIIFCMSSGSKHLVGKNTIVPKLENYSFGAFCSMFRMNTSNDINYISYFLQSDYYKNYIFNFSQGVNILNLKNTDLEKMSIPLPSLSIQKLIVQKLDTAFKNIDESIKNTKKNIENIEELNKSVLNEEFQDGKYNSFKLSEICIIERGGSPRPIKSFLTNDIDGINWIKIGDTKNIYKYIEKTNEKIRPEGIKKSRIVYPGDFILSNSMSFGRPYIMKTTGCIHDGWLVLRTDKNLIDDNFLYHLLGSPYIYEKFVRTSSGTTVKNLNITKVKDIVVDIPAIEKQKEIVLYLDEVFEKNKIIKEGYKNKLEDLEEMKQSILKEAFEGRLIKE